MSRERLTERKALLQLRTLLTQKDIKFTMPKKRTIQGILEEIPIYYIESRSKDKPKVHVEFEVGCNELRSDALNLTDIHSGYIVYVEEEFELDHTGLIRTVTFINEVMEGEKK